MYIERIRHGFFACPSSFSGRNSSLSNTGLTVSLNYAVSYVESYAFANAHITQLNTERLSTVYGFIDNYAFMNNDFTGVTIQGYNYIGNYSFANCKNLSSVRFDSAGTEVEDYAFSGCNNISYVYWPGTRASFVAKVSATGNSALLNAATIEYGTKTPINITSTVNVNVTEPIVGLRPDYKASMSNYYCELNPDSSGKAVTVWNKTDGNPQNNDKYAVGKAYTFTVYLKAKTGKDTEGYDAQYLFTQTTPITINNKPADKVTLINNGEAAKAEYTFAAKPVTFVDTVNLTITAPTAGAKPNFTVTKDNNNCDFYTGLGLLVPYGTGLQFIKGEAGSDVFTDATNYMAADETFQSGQKYTARVFLTTMDRMDTYFEPEFSAKINGKAATLGTSAESGKETLMWVDYTFTLGGAGAYTMGDVDKDGDVDNTDAVLLKRYAMNWPGSADKIKNMAAADLNGDSKVDNTDAILLKRCVMNWSGYRDKYCKIVNG